MRRVRSWLIIGLISGGIALATIPVFAALDAAAAPASCTRDQLGVRSNGIDGAAGTIHGAWVFTNLSKQTCTLKGYPDLRMYGKAGRPIPTTVRRSLLPGPTLVTLAQGDSATFLTSYSDVQSGSERCATSAVLAVTPPHADASLFIPAKLQACGGIVKVSAVRAGVHHP